jgi:hypothetical protein
VTLGRQFEQLALPGTDVPAAPPKRKRDLAPLVTEDGMPHWYSPRDNAGYQTRMLMPTREVIDTVHKIDSDLFQGGEGDPRAQWEDVTEGGMKASPSVREGIRDRDPIPPIRVQHPYKRRLGHVDSEGYVTEAREYDYEPELWDGHHRLYEFEQAGHTEVPVYESFDRLDAGPGSGFTGLPYWRHRPKRS